MWHEIFQERCLGQQMSCLSQGNCILRVFFFLFSNETTTGMLEVSSMFLSRAWSVCLRRICLKPGVLFHQLCFTKIWFASVQGWGYSERLLENLARAFWVSGLYPPQKGLLTILLFVLCFLMFDVTPETDLYWLFTVHVYCKAPVAWTCQIRPRGRGEGALQQSSGGGEAAAILISCEEREKERGKKETSAYTLTSYLHIHSRNLSYHFFWATGPQTGWPLLALRAVDRFLRTFLKIFPFFWSHTFVWWSSVVAALNTSYSSLWIKSRTVFILFWQRSSSRSSTKSWQLGLCEHTTPFSRKGVKSWWTGLCLLSGAMAHMWTPGGTPSSLSLGQQGKPPQGLPRHDFHLYPGISETHSLVIPHSTKNSTLLIYLCLSEHLTQELDCWGLLVIRWVLLLGMDNMLWPDLPHLPKWPSFFASVYCLELYKRLRRCFWNSLRPNATV